MWSPTPQPGANGRRATEKATHNNYILTIGQYEITVRFQHVKTDETVTICEISNLALNAHAMMDLLIKCIDSWLQYGIVYDYIHAQGIES